jgi:heme exporter protein B
LKLSVENLACRRSGRLIFDRLSFGVAEGEALLVTGRNGAGKSSLLAILAGRLRPEAGTIVLEGAGERTRSECLHVVGHQDGLKTALTAEENLAFASALLGDPTLPPRAALEVVGLGHAAALPVAYLSAGQRRRVALARLLVAARPLWLLDEPTAALDAASQAMLTGLMRRHLERGGLIVAATHQVLDVAASEVRIDRAHPSADDRRDDSHASPLVGEGPEGHGASEQRSRGHERVEAGQSIGDAGPPGPTRAGRGLEDASASSRGRGAIAADSPSGASPPLVRPFAALIARDLKLATRVGGSGSLGLVFFLMIVTLVPFALGPDLNLLARIGPAILWIAAVLATLIGLDRLFQADEEDGSLDLMRCAAVPLEAVVLAKVIAHWLTTGLPLSLAAPLFGLLVALSPAAMLAMVATLLVGTPALTFVGAIGAALTASLRRGGLILAILVLPLMIPTLIFGVSAANAATSGTIAFATPLLILAALSLTAAVVGTLGAAAALRFGE